MFYLLAYLLPADAQEFHDKIVKDVASKFDVRHVLDQNITPHITLKYPFETEYIKELEKFLADFCSKYDPQEIELRGFNHFDDRVIFMDVQFSDSAKKIYKDLFEKLHEFNWMQWDQWDSINMKFHSTIASDDINEKFHEIYDYLKQKKCNFDVHFDNISILKYENNHWKIYKKFLIK